MPFKTGTQIWKQREFTGRFRSFENAEELLKGCYQYFEWSEKNPLKEQKLTTTGAKKVVNKMRVLSVEGLCVFIGISRQTWLNYGAKDHDFFAVCEYVNSVMHDQKLAGACAGLLNPAIIARSLGLADKKEVAVSDKTMTPWESIECGDDET
jgi:hypothetical protein